MRGVFFYAISGGRMALIFIFIKEKVFLRRIIWPDVLDGFIHIAFIFQFLQVFHHFNGSAATDGVVYKLVFRGRLGCILQVRGQF